jgi:stringent starvation protein B
MSDGPQKLPPKKEVALALLEGPSMFVHLDPRRAGVLVPKRFLDKAQLVLQIGLNMFIPITDLKVDEEGISCTLSFDRAPFWCRMPWGAIYALVGEDGRGMMWPSDIPPEVVAAMQNPAQKDAGAAKPQAKRPRAKLAAVGEAPSEREPKAVEEAKEPEPKAAAESEKAPAVEAPSSEEPKDGGSQEPDRPQGSPAAGRKPRRELPPYLRVIK